MEQIDCHFISIQLIFHSYCFFLFFFLLTLCSQRFELLWMLRVSLSYVQSFLHWNDSPHYENETIFMEIPSDVSLLKLKLYPMISPSVSSISRFIPLDDGYCWAPDSASVYMQMNGKTVETLLGKYSI